MMMLRRKCIISFIICLWINFVWGVSDTCDLKNVAASYNLKLTSWWNKVQLNNKKHAISFTVGSKEAVIDGTNHVSVRPTGVLGSMESWYKDGKNHPYTYALKGLTVKMN